MVDKETVRQIFGSLMKKPHLFLERDKYNLSPSDFHTSFEQLIFKAVYNLFEGGAKRITVVDVDNYLMSNPGMHTFFEKKKGIQYLQDAEEFTESENFDYYYKRLKKLNAVGDLQEMGFNTSGIYSEDPFSDDTKKINDRFEEISIQELFANIQQDISGLSAKYGAGSDTTETIDAQEGLAELVERLKLNPDVGSALQGHITNTVARGARKGKYYLRSAASGVGKSRLAVGDACHLAYPIRFNSNTWSWELNGACEKTLFIATEQEHDEIQTLILAYLVDMDEEKILYGDYSEMEAEVIKQGLEVMEYFKNNLLLVQIPGPNVEKIKSTVRRNWIEHGIENVFFDYIFVNPSLLGEFRDLRLRNDEALLLLSSALKDIAVELQVFVMSSSQLNAKGDGETGEIRGESSLRGARALADKADMGIIVSRIKQEEKELLENTFGQTQEIPNLVFDIYKARRSRFTQVKVWSAADLGTCRLKDLFMTDASYNPVNDFQPMRLETLHPDRDKWSIKIGDLNGRL